MGTHCEPGTLIDGYTVVERLHSGGMAVIYRVTKPGLTYPAVMKIPRLGHGEPGSSVISFEVEQMMLEILKGHHVPRYEGSGDMAVQPYLVMEEVKGKPLHDWAEEAPLKDPKEIASLGAALAGALHSIHLQDAVHLDVKPGNVIIRPNGQAVLIDFGLSHHARLPDLLAEEWRKPIGSAPYIAPEQVMGVRNDHRSDIFALGVILYELATGKLPFGSPKSYSGLRQRLWKEPVPPRVINPQTPVWLQEVILHCLEIDLDKRYKTAAQTAFDLSHPDHVEITERGRRSKTAGLVKKFKRWLAAAGYEQKDVPLPMSHQEGGPIVLVAVATTQDNPDMDLALRKVARHLIRLDEQTRFSVLSVIPPADEVAAESEEKTATGQQIKHRVRLRSWAEPLKLPQERLTYHVIEADDAAEAILDYARVNSVSHIVIGSPPLKIGRKGRLGFAPVVIMSDKATEPVPLVQLMKTVSMRVAAAAPCTVTVVRVATS